MKHKNHQFLGFAGLLNALFFIFVSCENVIEEFNTSTDETLILNCVIDPDMPQQYAFLDVAYKNTADYVHDGVVRYSINGGESKVAPIDTIDLYKLGYNRVVFYSIKDSFKSGDKVHIEAEARGQKVYSDIEVPTSGSKILKVDTISVLSNTGYIEHNVLQFQVDIQDRVGVKDYYAVDLLIDRKFVTDGGKEYNLTRISNIVDGTPDPILSGESYDVLEDLLFSSSSEYNIFTDDMFADKTYTLRFNADPSRMRYDHLDNIYLGDDESGVLYTDVYVRISSLPFILYRYYKSIVAYENAASFFSDPVVFPENIVGGRGLFSASASTTYKISLNPVHLYSYYDHVSYR